MPSQATSIFATKPTAGATFFAAPTNTTFKPTDPNYGKDVDSDEDGSAHDVDYCDPEEDGKVAIRGLKDVVAESGTQEEVCIFKQRAKLFRFRDNQWKERGVGNAKLIRHDGNKRIRFVMRQEKTLKPCGNFIITEPPSCNLSQMGSNDKSFMWACMDFSDPEKADGCLEKLAIRFMQLD